MQEIKHILFVPHSPEQPINAVILSKTVQSSDSAWYFNHVATSVEHLDLSNVIDTVVLLDRSRQKRINCVTRL